jgi:iron-sulfur cluster repair protein YtfE (RIC family)
MRLLDSCQPFLTQSWIINVMLRDKNLIPLSRQHQHALALCVRINRAGLSTPAELKAWQSEAQQHFEQEMQYHFTAEEAHLFPAARQYPELGSLVDELLVEHAQLRDFFTQACGCALDSASLRKFAEVLATHIRKEERQLFQGMQKKMKPEELFEIGQRLGEALVHRAQACIVPAEATLKNSNPKPTRGSAGT